MGEPLEGRPVVLLGAGGAARAVFWALASRRAGPIRVLNRDPERARGLVAELGRQGLDGWAGPAVLEPGTVVVQATPLGTWPGVEETRFPWPQEVPPGVVACDLVYRPRRTRFLREAAGRGARVLGGLGMLLHQAAAAVEIWTGLEAPLEVMRRAAEEALGAQAQDRS